MQPVSQIVPSYFNYSISQLFSPSLLNRLTDPLRENDIRELLVSSGLYAEQGSWDLSEAINIAYKHLKAHYRCEYVYKNEIANQILLNRHADNSATLLKEITSDKSIADIVIVNGLTTAYEIKTELDTFDRLPEQLKSYRSLYDKCFVVTHINAISKLHELIDDTVGIIVMNEDGQLITEREAIDTSDLFEPEKAVLTLRQSELIRAYEVLVGPLPIMGNGLIYEFCHNWYKSLAIFEARKIFATSLKSRGPSQHQFRLVLECDHSLKILFLGKDLSKKYVSNVSNRLGIFV